MSIYTIEGNIGSGKSSLLSVLKSTQHNKYVFIDEPVEEWNDITDEEGKTILEHFYSDMKKYSFSFQMMAYISRLVKLKDVLKEHTDKIIICERSLFTDRNVFCKMLYEDKNINEIDYKIYNKWFNSFLDDIQIKGVIYVQTDPDICLNRIKIRNRQGEVIPLEYLKRCHYKHEEWILPFDNKLIINGSQEFISNISTLNNILNDISQFIHKKNSKNSICYN
jgi:deoxyadenosine/deoxycytidine kinase